MATIDELLNSSDVIEDLSDAIIIDPVARKLIMPTTELILGVAGDKNSECKYFKMPAIVGNGISVAACRLRVLYRPVGSEEVLTSTAKDFKCDGTSAVFCWEVPEEATANSGDVKFSICIYDPTVRGREWHTTDVVGKVLPGLICAAMDDEEWEDDELITGGSFVAEGDGDAIVITTSAAACAVGDTIYIGG